MRVSGRKDAFPGADGSTITIATGTERNAETIQIYDVNGNALIEGSPSGLRLVDITAEGILTGTTSQTYAIKNPLSFIYNVSSPRDWYTNTGNHNDELWRDGERKSTYDPCPDKWRVPPDASKTFGDFSTNILSMISAAGNNMIYGGIYNQMFWYPAVGYRRNSNGELCGVGIGGYYWSSTATSTNAKGWLFTMTSVNPNTEGTRSYGFPVRCVQE